MTYKIAVVEDNPDNRMLVQALLEDTYEISEYETGVEAINGLGDDIPDLILLDISLPEMDGTEVLAWIRDQDALDAARTFAVIALDRPRAIVRLTAWRKLLLAVGDNPDNGSCTKPRSPTRTGSKR